MADSGKSTEIQSDPILNTFAEGLSGNSSPLQFSINQMTTLRSSLDEDLAACKRAGVSAIGLWRNKIDEAGEQAAIDAIRKSALDVTTLSYAGGFTGSSGLQFQEALDDGYNAVFTAASVGARTLVISPGARGRYTAKHEFRLVVQAIRELSFVAQEMGVQLAVMPRCRRLAGRWTSLHDLEDAVALCDATGQSNVGVVYDTFYLAESVSGTLKQHASRIFVLQLRDAKESDGDEYAQCIPGTGGLPLEATVQCLLRNGFRGDIDIQVCSEELWKQAPEDVLSACRRSVQALLRNSLLDAVLPVVT